MANPTWDDTVPSFDETTPVPALPQKKGMMRRAWEALAVPEQKSREGLAMLNQQVPEFSGGIPGALAAFPMARIAGPLAPLALAGGASTGEKLSPSSREPSGHLLRDVVTGTPKVMSSTMAEAAPGFISRGALLTAGAGKVAQGLAPIAKLVGKGAASQLESLSGAAPGSVEHAAQDATLIFSKGKKAVGQMYEAAKEGASKLTDDLLEHKEIVNKATELLKKGELAAEDALTARKSVDAMMKSKRFSKDMLLRLREAFADVAKPKFAEADKAFQRAVHAESLRKIFPQNIYGGTSSFKMAMMTGLNALGRTGKAASVLLSPAAMGTAATLGGLGVRYGVAPLVKSPALAVSAKNAYSALQDALKNRKKGATNAR